MNNKVYVADLTHTGNGTMALTFPLGASYVASYAKKIKYKFFHNPDQKKSLMLLISTLTIQMVHQ